MVIAWNIHGNNNISDSLSQVRALKRQRDDATELIIKSQMIMAIHKVHNLQEGSRPGNWLKYWEDAIRRKATNCHKLGCMQKATDGAHVQLDDPTDRRWYIVPLCHKCNCQFGEHFYVDGPLVCANDPSVIRW